MSQSNFSSEGLPIGAGDRNMTYLYGVSDFWTTIFEDSEKVNLFLEASTQKLGEIYSHFLQLCSTISLEDIQVYSNKQLKLVLLGDSSVVAGKVNTYYLPSEVITTQAIANRPLLPTLYLEKDVHFNISEGGTEISFNSNLASLGFPARVLSTGEKQYALWFVDAEIDEQFIYNYFGKILFSVAPEKSTEAYKNFIYGLHYLFINGPDLATMKKGLNIALGIPLARDTETVLETRKYLNTDQYLVITDSNSYLIPYGLEPSVAAGDVVQPTQELASWIEVKDYRNDGEWWINLQIPPHIMPYIPPGEPDRYAKAGSYADYIMRNYLKTHTFLVNVKTIDFKNLQTFEQLFDIIRDAKPSYTTPVYIWTVPTGSENMELSDELLFQYRQQFRCENLSSPIEKMNRKLVQYATIGGKGGHTLAVGNDLTWEWTWTAARADIPLTSGKWYWEITNRARYSVDWNVYMWLPRFAIQVGVTKANVSLDTVYGPCYATGAVGFDSYATNYGASKPDSPLYLGPSFNNVVYNGSIISSVYAAPIQPTDVIGVTFNADTGEFSISINGVSYGVAYTVPVDVYYAYAGSWDGNVITTINFGEREFQYPPADPTINLGIYKFRYGRQYPQFWYDKHPSIIVNNNTVTGTVGYLPSARGSIGTVIAATEASKSAGLVWIEFSFSTTDPSGYFGWVAGIGKSTDDLGWAPGVFTNTVGYMSVKSGITAPYNWFSGFVGSGLLRDGVLTLYASPDARALQLGDKLGILFDAGTGQATFYKNGVSTGVTSTIGAGPHYLEIACFAGTSVTVNLGETPFTYLPPNNAIPGWFTDNSVDDRLLRGCPQFLRSNSNWTIYGQLGNDPGTNGGIRSYDDGTITGFIGSNNQFQENKELQVNEWISALMTRDSEVFGKSRSVMAFNRGKISTKLGEQTYVQGGGLARKVLLHLTTQQELTDRMALVGQTIPDLSTWEWSLFKTQASVGEPLNTIPVNTSVSKSYLHDMFLNFYTIFTRTGKPYLGSFVPSDTGYETYTPQVTDLRDGDYLWCVRIYENTIGVFWITTNLAAPAPNVRPARSNDALRMSMRNIPLRRGDGMYSPYYIIRGGGTNSPGNSLAVNAGPVNSSIDSGSKINVYYSDVGNITPIPVDRSGVVININKDLA